MTPEEKSYQGVYNGITSNVDTNYINDNSVRKYGSHSSAVADEYVDLQSEGLKQKIWDDEVSPEAVERANKNMYEEDAGVDVTKEVNEAINKPVETILSIRKDIKDLQEALENICGVMMDFVDEHNKGYDELKNHEKKFRLIETIITRQDKAISRLEQKINKMQSRTDDSGDLKSVDGAPASDNQQESSTGRLLGYLGSGDKELNIPVKLDDKGIDFFAGLKDIAKEADKDKESDKSDEDDSAMGRPFCKVVKGKMLKQDLSEGVDINEYKFPKSATYRINYMHFFRNMHRWGSFNGFEVELSSSNRPIQGERALLCLGNIDFAIVTIKSYGFDGSIYFANVEDVRLIPSFFKLGKIFGAKTYPEFMDAIEVTR